MIANTQKTRAAALILALVALAYVIYLFDVDMRRHDEIRRQEIKQDTEACRALGGFPILDRARTRVERCDR